MEKIYSARGRSSVQRVKRNELYKYVIYSFFLFIIYLLAEICKAFMLVHVCVILEIAMDMKLIEKVVGAGFQISRKLDIVFTFLSIFATFRWFSSHLATITAPIF